MSISGLKECSGLNQIPGQCGNGKCRESTAIGPQPCKIEMFDRPDIPITSTGSGFFTDYDVLCDRCGFIDARWQIEAALDEHTGMR
jgi:hypothetical protein